MAWREKEYGVPTEARGSVAVVMVRVSAGTMP